MIPRPSDEWVAAVECRHGSFIGHRVREASEMPYAEFKKLPDSERDSRTQGCEALMQQRLQDWVSAAEVRIRIKPEHLAQFLHDGRYRTLFETGASGGTSNVELRRAVEARVLNVAPDTAPASRPVSAYLSGSDESGAIGHYGSIVLCLKAETKDRAAFVLGDTLDATAGAVGLPTFAPAPVLAPTLIAVSFDRKGLFQATSLDAACHGGLGYAEAHLHGGVMVTDVSRAVFLDHQAISADLRTMLRATDIEIQAGPEHL